MRTSTLIVTAVFTLWVHAGAAQVRIMPLGDSLTTELHGQASYRYWLWKRLQAGGYAVDFVGSNWGVAEGGPALYTDFDADNEGHPSATTDDILYALRYWATRAQPDVVLLLVGATDFERGRSVSYVLNNTARIISTLRSVNPRVAIVWAMLPPGKDQVRIDQAYNSAILRLAGRWSGRNSPIYVVDLWSDFYPRRDTIDGQHPNAVGERKFANRFYAPLISILSRYGQGP